MKICAGLCFVALLSACSTTQSRYVELGNTYLARADTCAIDVFREGAPTRDFERISRLDVHQEKTHFIGSDFDSALPELKKQACRSGADGVVDIRELTDRRFENRSYHVTATGIKYKD